MQNLAYDPESSSAILALAALRKTHGMDQVSAARKCVNFQESQNEQAVIVTIPSIRFKTTAENAQKTIDGLVDTLREWAAY